MRYHLKTIRTVKIKNAARMTRALVAFGPPGLHTTSALHALQWHAPTSKGALEDSPMCTNFSFTCPAMVFWIFRSWDPSACTHFSSCFPSRTSAAWKVPSPPGLHCTSAPDILPKYSLCGKCWDNTNFSFSYPAKMPSVCRASGDPSIHMVSLSCLAMAPIVWTAQRLHPDTPCQL